MGARLSLLLCLLAEVDELLLVFAGGAARALADPELGLRLYTSDGTPTGRRPLPRGAQPVGDVGWSDDEGRLLLSLVGGQRTETWLLDVRGAQPRRLGEGAAPGWGK